MRSMTLILLFCAFFLALGSAPRGKFYQVITSHPEDLDELRPYIKTTHKSGRLWLVHLKKNIPQELMKYLQEVDGNKKSYLYEVSHFLNPRLFGDDLVSEYLSRLSPAYIKRDVIELSSYKTRITGSSDNQKALARVAERLKSFGYSLQEICFSKTACNLVADKKGSENSSQVLMVMGHIDSVGEAFAGADDNASGTAVLLEMARVLKDYPNRKTLRFFVTNGEEQGLLGSSFYAKNLAAENKIKDIKFSLNMDMVGYNHDGVVELETDEPFETDAQALAGLAAKYTKLKTKITIGAWGSDHVPFIKRGVPTILTIENWETKTPCYHLDCDTPETLNYEYATEIAKLNTAAIIVKDAE
jgi:hypothetical protein